MDFSPKECAGRQNHGTTVVDPAVGGDDAADMTAIIDRQITGFRFLDYQIWLLRQQGLNRRPIACAICLGAWPPDCGAFASVQDTKLDSRRIDRLPHQTVEGVDFADEVASAKASNCRVAGHDADGFALLSQKARPSAKACTRCSRLDSGMTAANDDNVVADHGAFLSFRRGIVNGCW